MYSSKCLQYVVNTTSAPVDAQISFKITTLSLSTINCGAVAVLFRTPSMSKNMIGRAAEFLKFSLNEEALKLYRFVKDLFVFFSRREREEDDEWEQEEDARGSDDARAQLESVMVEYQGTVSFEVKKKSG